jgi:flagellar biosynthesis protein FliQ
MMKEILAELAKKFFWAILAIGLVLFIIGLSIGAWIF